MRVIEEDTVLFHARRVEIIRGAAHAITSVSYAILRPATAVRPFITQLGNGDGLRRDSSITDPAGTGNHDYAHGFQIAQRIHAFVQRASRHCAANGFRCTAVFLGSPA